MPSIQIKQVPDDVHEIVRRRASAAGQSLQEYLLAWLTRDARSPTVDEVLDEIALRSGGKGSFASVNEILRADREAH